MPGNLQREGSGKASWKKGISKPKILFTLIGGESYE